MQLVLHNNNSTEIMDLSLKKSIMEANTIHSSIVNNDHPVISKHENSSTSTSKSKKSLSFSVDRLLKSVSDEDTSSTSSNSKIGKIVLFYFSPIFFFRKTCHFNLTIRLHNW